MQTLPAFLLKTVENKCLDYLRHTAVHAQYADYYLHAVDQCYEDNDIQKERQRQVEEMLDLILDTTRHVLEECYLNHKKYREVADEMNVCQETSIKRHIIKALKLVKRTLSSNKKLEKIIKRISIGDVTSFW